LSWEVGHRFLFIRHLPPLMGERPVRLPAADADDNPRMTLGTPTRTVRERETGTYSYTCPLHLLAPARTVLDLDETLVHCSTVQVAHPDRVFQVPLNGQVFDVCGRLPTPPHPRRIHQNRRATETQTERGRPDPCTPYI
jgi:hypothetical protein